MSIFIALLSNDQQESTRTHSQIFLSSSFQTKHIMQAAFGQKILEDGELRDAVDLGLDAVEGGAALTALEQLRKFGIAVAEFFARVL